MGVLQHPMQTGRFREYRRTGRTTSFIATYPTSRIMSQNPTLTRLICFDLHNRFNHHDFRVMATGTSTVWAFPVNLT
jgi:hypothetical protein